MKECPNCHAQLPDDAQFCGACGANQNQYQDQNQYQNPYGYAPPASVQAVPFVDPYDHTAEFDPKDISDNKVISMLVYLMGVAGVIIALLAAGNSPYAAFHVRQSLKFSVVEILGGIITVLLCWTVLVPIAYGILLIVLLVVKIICFFQICSGKAKEPAIICKLSFLR
jgi:uncharacterized membrane protein